MSSNIASANSAPAPIAARRIFLSRYAVAPAVQPSMRVFAGDDAGQQTAANFARLADQSFAYTPYIPKGDEHVKKPEWLNDIAM